MAFLRTNIKIIDRFLPGEVSEKVYLSGSANEEGYQAIDFYLFYGCYRRFLKPERGIIHFKDGYSNFMFTYTRGMITEENKFSVFITEDLYHSGSDDILGIKTIMNNNG